MYRPCCQSLDTAWALELQLPRLCHGPAMPNIEVIGEGASVTIIRLGRADKWAQGAQICVKGREPEMGKIYSRGVCSLQSSRELRPLYLCTGSSKGSVEQSGSFEMITPAPSASSVSMDTGVHQCLGRVSMNYHKVLSASRGQTPREVANRSQASPPELPSPFRIHVHVPAPGGL